MRKKNIRGKTPFRKNIWKPQKGVKFQCNTCHRKFPTYDKLRSHVKMEHTKVTCDVYENTFYRINLKKHCVSIHGILAKDAFKCHFCPMLFKFKKNLKRHAGSKHDWDFFFISSFEKKRMALTKCIIYKYMYQLEWAFHSLLKVKYNYEL